MKANYKISESAKKDIESIYRYGISEYGETQADLYYDAMFKQFEKIAENPYIYQPVDYIRKGYRRSIFANNSIFYRISEDMIEIMAILSRQNSDILL